MHDYSNSIQTEALGWKYTATRLKHKSTKYGFYGISRIYSYIKFRIKYGIKIDHFIIRE